MKNTFMPIPCTFAASVADVKSGTKMTAQGCVNANFLHTRLDNGLGMLYTVCTTFTFDNKRLRNLPLFVSTIVEGGRDVNRGFSH